MTGAPRRILFVELLGGIGDLVIALPAIQALGRSHAGAELTVLTFAPGAELLRRDPHVARVVAAPRGGARRAVAELLAGEPFDLVVSDTRYEGIDALIAASGARAVTDLWRSPPEDERVGERFLRILLDEGVVRPEAVAEARIHLGAEETAAAAARLAALPAPRVVLLPDAGMPVKRWPAERFVHLGEALHRGRGASLLVAEGDDPEEARRIADRIGAGATVLARGSLRELAAALAQADLAIGADTGPLRMAAALGVRTVGLFGPSWHGRYGHPPPHAELQGHPGCPERIPANFTEQRCWYGGRCPLGGWETCLEDIAPAAVLAEAERLLGADPALRPEWARVRRILAVRLDNLGDVVMTGPALRALKAALPEARVTLLATRSGARAAELLPWVDEVIRWRPLWQEIGDRPFDPADDLRLAEALRARGFDAAVIFTSFSQSPHPPAALCLLAGIPLRVGESREEDEVLTTAVRGTPHAAHQVERNLRLVEAVGVPVAERALEVRVPRAARERATRLLAERGVPPGGPYLLLNPWTSSPTREYAPERFAAAARALAERTGWPVVVTGVAADRERSAALLDAIGPAAVDLVGATGVAELAAVLAGARLLLTNNTSTMHLADALRVPAVVLFSGTELEAQWRPRHGPHRLLRRPTPCNPCYAFTCPHAMACLDIPADEVVEAGMELLAEGEGSGAGTEAA